MSELTRIISLLYRMDDNDERQLVDNLLNIRVVMYQNAIEREARRYGENISANPPSGADYAALRRMSERDAMSIVATYNRDVERQVERIYQNNPRANRYEYARQMEQWAGQRTTRKQAQIALNTDTTTTEYARRRWFEENFDSGSKYKLSGATAVCKDCLKLFAMGVVSEQVVQKNKMPLHVNCVHQWNIVNPRRKAGQTELWRG